MPSIEELQAELKNATECLELSESQYRRWVMTAKDRGKELAAQQQEIERLRGENEKLRKELGEVIQDSLLFQKQRDAARDSKENIAKMAKRLCEQRNQGERDIERLEGEVADLKAQKHYAQCAAAQRKGERAVDVGALCNELAAAAYRAHESYRIREALMPILRRHLEPQGETDERDEVPVPGIHAAQRDDAAGRELRLPEVLPETWQDRHRRRVRERFEADKRASAENRGEAPTAEGMVRTGGREAVVAQAVAPASPMNWKVAEALGYEVVPARKANGGTFEVGKKYLFAHGQQLSKSPATASIGGDCFGPAEPWNPAESPADAQDALTEFCDARGWTAKLEYHDGQWTVHIPAHGGRGYFGELCPTICQAIIHAGAGK